MPQPNDAPGMIPPAHAADRLPRHTTPTWEVELLISGVAVFAMLQLPGLLDDTLFALRPRFDPVWTEPANIFYVYLKSAAVILAATFAIHLLLRARWIALVGMHSVYPDGILWERLRMGPIQREVARRQDPGAAITIDTADNQATIVFSTGVMMAMLLLAVSLMVAILFVATMLGASFAGIRIPPTTIFLGCAILITCPLLVSMMLDRRIGARLDPQHLPRRALSLLFRIYGRLGMGNGNAVMNLLSSHSSEWRSVLMILAVFLPVMFGILSGMKAEADPERFGGYAAFPQPAANSGRTLDTAHYDRTRDISRDPAVPYIQGLVVSGPYLQLVVPFRPGEDDAALQRACPRASAVTAATAATRDLAVLDCLQRLHAATLDGKPLPALRYDASSDPRTDRPALVAMIDVRALAKGQHELRVARTDVEPGKTDAVADEQEPQETQYIIPFWR